jgi:hypothetical protein
MRACGRSFGRVPARSLAISAWHSGDFSVHHRFRRSPAASRMTSNRPGRSTASVSTASCSWQPRLCGAAHLRFHVHDLARRVRWRPRFCADAHSGLSYPTTAGHQNAERAWSAAHTNQQVGIASFDNARGWAATSIRQPLPSTRNRVLATKSARNTVDVSSVRKGSNASVSPGSDTFQTIRATSTCSRFHQSRAAQERAGRQCAHGLAVHVLAQGADHRLNRARKRGRSHQPARSRPTCTRSRFVLAVL